MTWLSRLLPQRKSSLDGTLELFREIYGGRLSKSGKVVSWKTALEVSTAIACARVIAEGLAQVPLKIFRAQGTSKVAAPDHPLYSVLALRPNPWQTSFEFFETLGLHVVFTGRAYAFINRVRGEIRELIPLEPSAVSVNRASDWTLTYNISYEGETRTVPASSIWHIKGPSWCVWQGLDAVNLARDAIGLAIATEESHASLHRAGVQTTGTWSVEGTLTADQHKQITEWIAKNQGSQNAGRPLILDRNAKWLSQVMSGVDAQHLETRRYQVEDICRHFRVMPIMVGYSDKATTYASSEQMFLAHVVHTLSPWYRRFEQSIDANLLTPNDIKQGYSSRFVIQDLLRGALKDTKDYLVGLTTMGILTRNEAREILERNPIDGLDEPLTPVNLGIGAEPNEPNDPTGDKNGSS